MFGIQHAKTKTFESIDRLPSSFEEIPNVSAKSRASSTGISIARRRGDILLFVYFPGAR